MMSENKNNINRRHFLKDGVWATCLAGLAGLTGFLLSKLKKNNTVWQIDPYVCVACGNWKTLLLSVCRFTKYVVIVTSVQAILNRKRTHRILVLKTSFVQPEL